MVAVKKIRWPSFPALPGGFVLIYQGNPSKLPGEKDTYGLLASPGKRSRWAKVCKVPSAGGGLVEQFGARDGSSGKNECTSLFSPFFLFFLFSLFPFLWHRLAAPLKMVFPKKVLFFARVTEQLSGRNPKALHQQLVWVPRICRGHLFFF